MTEQNNEKEKSKEKSKNKQQPKKHDRVRVDNKKTGDFRFGKIIEVHDYEFKVKYDEEYGIKDEDIKISDDNYKILTNTWLSCELRLDSFDIKTQSFSMNIYCVYTYIS